MLNVEACPFQHLSGLRLAVLHSGTEGRRQQHKPQPSEGNVRHVSALHSDLYERGSWQLRPHKIQPNQTKHHLPFEVHIGAELPPLNVQTYYVPDTCQGHLELGLAS